MINYVKQLWDKELALPLCYGTNSKYINRFGVTGGRGWAGGGGSNSGQIGVTQFMKIPSTSITHI